MSGAVDLLAFDVIGLLGAGVPGVGVGAGVAGVDVNFAAFSGFTCLPGSWRFSRFLFISFLDLNA